MPDPRKPPAPKSRRPGGAKRARAGLGGLEAPIQAMIDATNERDSPKLLAAFADDAVLVDWGRTFTGKSESPAGTATKTSAPRPRSASPALGAPAPMCE